MSTSSAVRPRRAREQEGELPDSPTANGDQRRFLFARARELPRAPRGTYENLRVKASIKKLEPNRK